MAEVAPNTGEGQQALTAAGRYEVLVQDREPYLRRAREAAKLTIPGLLPPDGSNGATDLPEPYQSVGADGVNNLSAQLLLVLFPPGTSFFRLRLDEFVKEEITGQNQEAAEEMEAALAKVERVVTNTMDAKGSRVVNFEALQHLIVTGNGLVQVLGDGREKFYPISKFVVKRDLEGTVLEIITKESLTKETLPKEAREIVAVHDQASDPGTNKSASVDLYTWVRRQDEGSWTVEQQVCGKQIPGSTGTYPKDKSAWLPLRWKIMSGEDYGRGLCEEKIGDLRSLESATKSIILFAAAAAKIIGLVNDGGTTDVNVLAKARSGDFVPGRKDDVTFLMLEKTQDFSVLKAVADKLEQRLDKAFLNASSVQRDAERVTAEEIRAMIGQLEQSLGGQYALLSEEFQRPLVVRVMHQLQTSRKLPFLPEKAVSAQIVTGIEGLGRMSDKNKLDQFIAGAKQVYDPPTVAEYTHPGEYFRRSATALGIEPKGLVKTDDEVAQERAQKAQQSMAEKTAPGLMGLVQKGAEMGGASAQPAAPVQ